MTQLVFDLRRYSQGAPLNCIYCPSSVFSYMNICFSLFLKKQARVLNVLKSHTCSDCLFSGSHVFMNKSLEIYAHRKLYIYIQSIVLQNAI